MAPSAGHRKLYINIQTTIKMSVA